MDDKKQGGNPGLILVAIVVLLVMFSGKQPPGPDPGPDPSTPLAQYVRGLAGQVQGSTRASEAAAIAANYRAVSAEIETLVDPLAMSPLKRPKDAVAKVNELNAQSLGSRSGAWRAFDDAVATRLETMDREGKIERSIYAVGQVYAEIAEGLALPRDQAAGASPRLIGGQEPGASARRLMRVPIRLCAAAEGTADYDPEAAAMAGQIGCYLDEDGQPAWAREKAREGDAAFAAAGGQDTERAFPRSFAGEGKGKRAVYWNYALRFDGDPLQVFAIKQITGNCVAASAGDVALTHLLGVSIFLLKKPYEWEGPGSTVFYSRRGHCGQGANLGTIAAAHLEDGAAYRKVYAGGKYDLRDTIADQKLGMQQCRNPKSSLADLWTETRRTPVGNVARFEGGAAEAMDILYAGGALHTGSTATASRDGDPVCSGGRVGPHAQTCIGYDDTEEFRQWYRQQTGKTLTEPVFLFDQTWGDAPYVKSNWPAHLWGKQTRGMFVLRWTDAKRLIGGGTYAYWPDLKGQTPGAIEWRLRHARITGSGSGAGGDRLAGAT